MYTQNTNIVSNTYFNETESCIRIGAHFLVKSQMVDFSVIWEARLDAQTVVLMLLELNSPCLPHRQVFIGLAAVDPSI